MTASPGTGRRPSNLLGVALVIVLAVFGCSDGSGTATPAQLVDAGAELFISEGCVNCHGDSGQGLSGPALANGRVIETFPTCEDQIRWVGLGSARWRQQEGASYGALARPVQGGMPGFGERLDDAQIQQVVVFTRVRFGGIDPAAAQDDCG